MKPIIVQYSHPLRGEMLLFWCPGCKESHCANIEKPNQWGAKWTWDGNLTQATLTPSIHYPQTPKCHFFVRAGKIEYLPDCDHSLAGQTVPMVPSPEQS